MNLGDVSINVLLDMLLQHHAQDFVLVLMNAVIAIEIESQSHYHSDYTVSYCVDVAVFVARELGMCFQSSNSIHLRRCRSHTRWRGRGV
jgi:hypothetical protein